MPVSAAAILIYPPEPQFLFGRWGFSRPGPERHAGPMQSATGPLSLSADCHLLRPGFCLFCSVPRLCSWRFSFHQVGFLPQPLMPVSCPAGPSPPNPPPPPSSVPLLTAFLLWTQPWKSILAFARPGPGPCRPAPFSIVCNCSPAGCLSCGHHRPQRGL